MIPIQAYLAVGAVVAIGAFGIGTQVQKGWDASACEKKIDAVRKASEKVINGVLTEKGVLQAERDQAKATVSAVNAASADANSKLQAMIVEDQAKRDEVAVRFEKAANQAAREAHLAADRAQAVQEFLKNVEDKCAGSLPPADLVRMLDGVLHPGAAP